MEQWVLSNLKTMLRMVGVAEGVVLGMAQGMETDGMGAIEVIQLGKTDQLERLLECERTRCYKAETGQGIAQEATKAHQIETLEVAQDN